VSGRSWYHAERLVPAAGRNRAVPPRPDGRLTVLRRPMQQTRYLRRDRPITGSAAGLAMAALLGGCLDLPTVPPDEPDAVGEIAFGAGQVGWWTPDEAGAWTMHPLLDGPRVYFSRDMRFSTTGAVLETGALQALDRETGARIWKGEIIAAQNAALAGGRVAAVWGGLPIFDPVSGAPLEIFRYGSTSLSTNVVSDGERFYVGSHDGHLLAVDPQTAAVDWEHRLAGGPSTRAFGLALEGDDLAVSMKHFGWSELRTDSGIVAVVDRGTGEPRWRVARGAPGFGAGIGEPPMIVGDRVVVRTQKYDVLAFHRESGALAWERNVAFLNV
jgi:outer membrane protein assembly factor BamB